LEELNGVRDHGGKSMASPSRKEFPIKSALVDLGAIKRAGGQQPTSAGSPSSMDPLAEANAQAEAVEEQHEKELLATLPGAVVDASLPNLHESTNGSKFAGWLLLCWAMIFSGCLYALILGSIKGLCYFFLCFRRERVEKAKLEEKYADREGRRGSATIDDVDMMTCVNGSNGLRNLAEALFCWEFLLAETVVNMGYCGGSTAGCCLTGCGIYFFMFIAVVFGISSFWLLTFSITDSMIWLVQSLHILVFGVSLWGLKIFIRTKLRGGRGTTTDMLKDACITCVPFVYQAGHFQEAEFVEVYGGKAMAKGDQEEGQESKVKNAEEDM